MSNLRSLCLAAALLSSLAFVPSTGVAQQLVQHSPPHSAAHNRSDLAASAFMSMVIGGPVRMLVTGMPLSASEIDDRIAFSVRLFVEGAGAA